MISTTICPVPKDQIPILEYEELSNSSFSSWPINGKSYLYKRLTQSWLLTLPLTLLISSGSIQLTKSPVYIILESISVSLFIPILLLVRQLLNWNYIFKRLYSHKIEYEESGWYDGQTWEKTIDIRTKDLLIAQHEVTPIIDSLKESLIIISILFFIGISILKIIM
tara:strand:+ start:8988 stop:9485 length:498 start_codon:yes stop_codon:yes gene_type:complete